jgi:uncharacterized protein (TIGR00299 family) protein
MPAHAPPTEARTAYLDPVSGISGDMLLGAIIAAGVEPGDLAAALEPLALPGWRIEAAPVRRAGFAATAVTVHLEGDAPPRTLRDILDLIERSGLPRADRAQAAAVFRLLGEAEAAVHGAPSAEAAHLHEVGAVDAIVDICGAVAGLRLLGVERLACGPLPLGAGSVRAAHGRLPVPAPAVLEIAARAQLPLAAPRQDEPRIELTTPTGAAIVAALATFERPALTLERVGVGAGRRDLDGWPNVLRLWLGRAAPAAPSAAVSVSTRSLVLVETNVDDMPAEHVPYLEERLREAGARDVWWSAAQMKKGRPGVQISAVAEAAAEQPLALAMLRHSSTLGVRVTPLTRYEAAREELRFDSSLGPAAVKVKRLPGAPPTVAPEYESARALATRHGLPLAEVYRLLTTEALAHLDANAE